MRTSRAGNRAARSMATVSELISAQTPWRRSSVCGQVCTFSLSPVKAMFLWTHWWIACTFSHAPVNPADGLLGRLADLRSSLSILGLGTR